MGSLLFTAVLVPMLSPATYDLSLEFDTSITDIALLTGYCLLCVGCFGPFVSAMSRIWGKRPQFLLASTLGVIGTIICECANDYNTLLAGRLIEGFSVAAYESLIVALVGDLYFVHQRGARVTVFQLVTNSFGVISPMISGVIYDHLGWKYIFHIAQPFLILQLIMVILFVPETAYNRDLIYEIDLTSSTHLDDIPNLEKNNTESNTERLEMSDNQPTTSRSSIPPVKTALQRMAIYNGRLTSEGFIPLLMAPFLLLTNPAVIWGCLTQGISSGWWVSTSFVLAQIWQVPPYNLTTAQVGYLYAGPAVGGFLGVLFMASMSDRLSLWVAHKNNGIYEPEFRIYPLVLAFISGAIGLFLFGNMIELGKGYIVASAMHGIYGFSINVAGAVMNSYIVDAYREEATEALVMAMVFKNFFFFGLSYFVNNWLAKVGPASYFDVQAGVVLAIYATGVPMYIFGKRIRSWWHRHDLLKKIAPGAKKSSPP